MAAPLVPLGQQLYNDIAHDFTRAAARGLNYSTGNDDGYQDEGGTVTSLLAAMTATGDPGFNARVDGQVIFTMPEGTSTFKAGARPILSPTGNENVGIIQDAGEFITLDLGANNVITYGSILDPATKPVAPEREPIWYDPGAGNSVTIDLAPFGFDPRIINSLVIQDLTAGNVKAGFVIGGRTKDAVAMSDIGPRNPVPIQPKPINKTEISLAGFFTSIAKAENLKRELRETMGYTPEQADEFVRTNAQYFYIGKTLGDVSLVASGLVAVSGAYAGIGEGRPAEGAPERTPGWKWWAGAPERGRLAGTPNILILKTGDQLNWIRAIACGLGAIYEDQAKGARKVKQYKFFPGAVSEEAMRATLLNGFEGILKASVTRRYTSVITSLNELIGEDGYVKPNVTNFSGEPTPVLRTPDGRYWGGVLIRGYIVPRLQALQTQVEGWVTRRRAGIDAYEIADLLAHYEETRIRANACSPATDTIVVTKSNGTYLSSKLIVTNVPPSASVPLGAAAGVPDWPVRFSVDIALRNAFAKFNNARMDSDFNALVNGTDINNRCLLRVVIADAGQVGGAIEPPELDVASIQETVNEVVEGIKRRWPDASGVKFHKRGVWDTEEIDAFFNEYPRFKDFAQYCGKFNITDPTVVFSIALEVRRFMGERYILDEVLAFGLTTEIDNMLASGTITSLEANAPTFGTVLFNAYTYHVNARNASFLVGDVTEDTQSTLDFDLFERVFTNNLLARKRTVSETTKLPPKAQAVKQIQSQGFSDAVRRFAEQVEKGQRSRTQLQSKIRESVGEGKPIDMDVDAYTAAGQASSAPLFVQGGGSHLQPRRPLYGNARTSAPPRRGLYA